PEGKRQDVYDSDVPGLVLRLLPTGTKTWSFTYRHQGKARRLSLGVYPGVNLKLARERAREARGAVQRGEDPVGDKKEQERDARMNGFESCARDFIEKYAKRRQRTWKQTEGLIQRFAIKEWGDRPVKEIRRRDVVDLLDKVALTTPYQANHLRAYLSRMFKWLIEREVVEVSPVIGVSPRTKP